MERSRIEAACRELPIFPLPRLVMLPRDVLPLHVFEPRYRALIAWCREGAGVLGMATLRPGFEQDYDGNPPIFPEIAVGWIGGYHALPDGRSNVIVEWLGRARLVEELRSPHLFRLVRCDLRVDVYDGPLDALKALVVQVGAYSETASAEAARLITLPPGEMLDEVARRMLEEPEDRRRYVGLDRLSERAEVLEERLADLVGQGSVGDA